MYKMMRISRRTTSSRTGLAVVATFILLVAANPVLAIPDFPPPKDAQVSWVGRNIVVNGIHSDIRSFVTKDKPEKVAEFYHEQWKKPVAKGKPGYTESDAMPPWHLITRLEDGYLMTVQYQEQDRGGTWGYLAMSPLPTKKSWIEPGATSPWASSPRRWRIRPVPPPTALLERTRDNGRCHLCGTVQMQQGDWVRGISIRG